MRGVAPGSGEERGPAARDEHVPYHARRQRLSQSATAGAVSFCSTLLLAAGCAAPGVQAGAGAGGGPEAVAAAAATITADELLERIAILADDSMGGRDTPSPGLEKAAAYLAAEFGALGLEPGAEAGWLQRYPYPLQAIDTTTVHIGIVDERDADNRMLVLGRDYFASPAPPFPDVAMGHGALVWAGDAEGPLASGPELAGQVMVVRLNRGLDPAEQGAAVRARAAARDAGARALMVVLGPAVPAEIVSRLAQLAATPARVLADPTRVPAFYVTHDAGRAIVERTGLALAELPAAPPEPLPLPGIAAHYAADARIIEPGEPPNVIALLEGGDPMLRDTYVVLTAHMDHQGIGAPDATGDSIYNGADDDASGTAALVEVAEAFAALDEPPGRSLIFLAVSGEEKGLLGSRWFSEHPTVPIESIVANINVDMISRNAPDSIVVIGQEFSSLGPLVRGIAAAHAGLGLAVGPDPWPEERFFFRSDHFNFARLEIPALFFFAGVHEDYHRPSDEVAKIDEDKAARVSRLIFLTAHAIADAEEPPAWTPDGLAEVRALTAP